MTPGIVEESDLSGNLTDEYVFFDGERVARKSTNGVFYYFSDHLKTASVITDSLGNIKSESDYYPWGGELQFVNNDSNHYKFTGKERDSETQLDYFGARYYSNGLGRWVSADWSPTPIPVPYADFTDPQSLNLYGYVRGIPTTSVDLDGHGCPPACEAPVEVNMEFVKQTLQQVTPGVFKGLGTDLAELGPAAPLAAPSVGAMIIVVSQPPMQNHPDDDSLSPGNMMLDALNPSYQPAPPLPTPNTQPATPSTQPNPQTPPAPQMAEHRKNKRKSTKDDHERRRPGTSPPPNYKPDRQHVQPKHDKKKDKKDKPYHRKDRDKKQEGS